MSKTALEILTEIRPDPIARRQALADVNVQISTLETRLGLPHKLPTLNHNMAIKRLADLQAKAGGATTPLETKWPPSPNLSAPQWLTDQPVPATALTSTAQLARISDKLFPGKKQPAADLPDSARRLAFAGMFWEARLTYPGHEADFAKLDSSKLMRNVSDDRFKGVNRSSAAIAQSMVSQILNGSM